MPARKAKSETLDTLRYLADFHCIGGDCPDTCCGGGWSVMIDADNYRRLGARMQAGSAEEQARFEQGVIRRNDARPSSNGYAMFRIEQGRCAFLEEDDLCYIHRRYGEELLCYTCSLFPRVFTVREDRLTMTATLSCPEAARLCLLHPGATDPVHTNTARAGLPARELRGRNYRLYETPGAEWAATVTDIFSQLLDFEPVPLGSRLFVIAQLANLLREGFADPQGAGATLAQDIASLGDPQVLLQLHEEYSRLQTDPAAGIALAQGFITHWVSEMNAGRLRELLLEIVKQYPLIAGEQDAGAARMLSDYQASAAYWRQHFGERLDGYRVNLCKNFFFLAGFPEFADPLEYVLHLLVQAVIVDYLLFLHPRVQDARRDDLATRQPQAAGELLDETVVDVVQRFYREMEHDNRLRDHMQTQLERQGMRNLAGAAYLVAV